MSTRTEDEMSIMVLTEMRKLLKDEPYKLGNNKRILTDVTCVPTPDSFKLVHGFADTDIAIYKEINIPINNSSFIQFYRDALTNEGKFAVPFIIIELKSGKKLNSDNIRAREHVASKIRELFPFTAYYFFAENTTKQKLTLMRQGKSFTDSFIFKNQVTKKEIESIVYNYMLPHIRRIERQLKTLGELASEELE